MLYMASSGTIVDIPSVSPVVDDNLRLDLVGTVNTDTIKILEVLGQVSKPTFAVAICSWCRPARVLRIKTSSPGLTHTICPKCLDELKEEW